MLREISGVKQDDPAAGRRWFRDDYFDLDVWTDPQGQLRSFPLAYEWNRRETVLSWDRAGGYRDRVVDGDEESSFSQMVPILSAEAGRFPKCRVVLQLDARATALDPDLRREIQTRVAAYPPRGAGR